MKGLLRGATRIHVLLYRVTGGRLGGRAGKAPILLLTTTGRRSGRERTTPLGYLDDGRAILICAANVGSDQHPGWFWNIKADPNVRVKMRDEEFAAAARVADPEERDRLWDRLIGRLPALIGYQEKTDRVIPVVLLALVKASTE